MHVTVFSAKPYDRRFLEEGNVTTGHSLSFLEACLSAATCGLAKGAGAVCVFVNDEVNAEVLASWRLWE
jgi:D-lactate dehydrogenase